jgi:hypothetical protein
VLHVSRIRLRLRYNCCSNGCKYVSVCLCGYAWNITIRSPCCSTDDNIIMAIQHRIFKGTVVYISFLYRLCRDAMNIHWLSMLHQKDAMKTVVVVQNAMFMLIHSFTSAQITGIIQQIVKLHIYKHWHSVHGSEILSNTH